MGVAGGERRFSIYLRNEMRVNKAVLGRAERSVVNELGDVRNKLSHNETFTYDDAERAPGMKST
ncbi:MAG TPA: Swt1 family HEPN domain-containing protein [Nitrospira sp.]|nr:Swt1 family HEPN domain-containing protein [Nitrospira sp.]